MPKRHTPKPLASLLASSSGSLANIAHKSQQLNTLSFYLSQSVGATIAQNCRVANYNNGILTIETTNSAYATRLNFLLAEILLNFRCNVLPELANIKVKVVPNEKFYRQVDKKTSVDNHPLSEKAAAYITEVAANAPASLKRSLERLAALQLKNR